MLGLLNVGMNQIFNASRYTKSEFHTPDSQKANP